MLPVITLTNPTPSRSDQFGLRVAISGTRVVVPATNNIVYLYDLNAATPTLPVLAITNLSPAAGNGFGAAVAISDTLIVVGLGQDDTYALDAGIAYVYDLAGVTPATPRMTLAKPHPAAGDYFGGVVALSGS